MAWIRGYLHELFDPQGYKEKFLNLYEGDTKESYRYVLSKASKLENLYDKELFDFNDIELDNLFQRLQAKSYQSITYQVSIFNKYIEFSLENRFSHLGTNQINRPMFTGDALKKYINPIWEDKKILTKEEVEDILSEIENYQIAVIMMLMFEGVMGEQMEEIINLRKEDVSFINNILTLTRNDGSIRKIEVSDECIDLIKGAIEETKLLKGNGESNAKIKTFDLIESDYVIRSIKRKDVKDKVTYLVVRQRFKSIKDYWENPYITPISIRTSGMIHYAKKWIKEKELTEFTTDNYKELNIRFGVSPETWFTTKGKIEKYL